MKMAADASNFELATCAAIFERVSVNGVGRVWSIMPTDGHGRAEILGRICRLVGKACQALCINEEDECLTSMMP